MPQNKSKVKFEVFRGSGEMTWDRLLEEAAAFANTLDAERVISICHSSDSGRGTVVIWYVAPAA